MTPQDFIKKWKPVALNERQTAQEHFLDLCRVFGHPSPAEADPAGESFSFEKGLVKTGGGGGFADVWKRGFFAWEYKKKKRDLDEALGQLVKYASALGNPPLHVVCDTVRFKIVTAWTNTIVKVYAFELEDLAEPENLKILHALFHDPDALKPSETRESLTKKAADKFQTISDRLQHRNPDREAVAHFVNQLVFCFFASSVKLLPDGVLRRLLDLCKRRPHRSHEYFTKLFEAMAVQHGNIDLTDIAWFNGGLFDGRPALQLDDGEIELLFDAASARLDWSLIDPTIFGTLFERFLDPDKRAQIGAHYTDTGKIMLIIEPVILRPLLAEWAVVKALIEAGFIAPGPALPDDAGAAMRKDRARKLEAARLDGMARRDAFITRLAGLRILDPACGSGNFLYLALQAVKDIEYRAITECELLGLGRPALRVGPEILRGIEINPFAAELARMTIWIGDIQWGRAHGIFVRPEPILRKLDTIECRDALLTRIPPLSSISVEGREGQGDNHAEESPHPAQRGHVRTRKTGEGEARFVAAEWPEADYIVGNPPFLGGKKLRNGRPEKFKTINGERALVLAGMPGLGDLYVNELFGVYGGLVAAESDLVCYWFYKSWAAVEAGRAKSAGLVATNSIRGGANRRVLEPIASKGGIFEAWSDEPWMVDGTAVRVSIVCFCEKVSDVNLNGNIASKIEADLTSATAVLTSATNIRENLGIAFMGDTKGGAFDVNGQLARAWLTEPLNVNGRPNSDVLIPWSNGLDITRRPRDMWIIDFGLKIDESAASFFSEPFLYAKTKIKPERDLNRRDHYRKSWWAHVESRPGMRRALKLIVDSSEFGGVRYIGTPTVSKYRIFVWINARVLPDHQLIVIARNDETIFGVLQSKFHEAWALKLGTSLGVTPRYTPTTTFETFPFPQNLTPNIPAAAYASDSRAQKIAAAAKRLDELRKAWLNPPDLVDIVPEIIPTAAPGEAPVKYPDRILPKNAEAAAKLKARTLTNLYNQRPQWLADAHAALDRAVAGAYGWPEDISTESALEKLLALNLQRAGR